MTTDFLLWQWSLITQLVSGAMIGGFFLVLAATTRAQRELRSSNDDLLRAQEALRAIVDVDPLTGLANRRALPGILRTVQPDGASLVFIDLRGFKQINDARGHAAGDDLLKRFAAAVQESVRPGDAVVRYAGDEFLVVAQGLAHPAMEARIVALRERLADDTSRWSSRITFDAGHSELEAGGHPDDAVQAADRAMYERKLDGRREGSDS
ncbi:MAG: GGDEF domain-containing protein [Gemmatimonadota bacterium]